MKVHADSSTKMDQAFEIFDEKVVGTTTSTTPKWNTLLQRTDILLFLIVGDYLTK